MENSPSAGQPPGPANFFTKELAETYDERFAKLAPLRGSLHLLIRILFSDLPEHSRILCVGVGTGAELLALALAFPKFTFTAVEPAEAMLAICQKRARDADIAARCTFHHGYIDTLPPSAPFDAATSLLVSQFLLNPADRLAFFQAIASLLRPNGYLANADLAGDLPSPQSSGMKMFWEKMLLHSGDSPERAKEFLAGWKRGVAVVPPEQIEAIIASAGFDTPTRFYQNLFIHAWFAKRR